MINNARIGVALLGGYVLGRTKKAKMALGLGMFLAGRRIDFGPRQLGKWVAGSPVLGGLGNQARTELLDATKSAMTSALSKRAGSLADSLHERTSALNSAVEESDHGGADDEQGAADADRDVEEETAGEERAPRRRPASTGSKARSASSGGRQTPADSSRPRKTAVSAARKGSSARKDPTGSRASATGAARNASERGGGNG
jgi:hypothetical protein